MKRQTNSSQQVSAWRLNLVRGAFILIVVGLGWRLADIEVLNSSFLRYQGDARHIRKVPIVAHRGMIMDRYGEPLAISTPVHSVWVNPQDIDPNTPGLDKLADLLDLSPKSIRDKIKANQDREFIYLKRRIQPQLANKVKSLNINGVELQREYKRYYPTAEVASHVVGFTNVDDVGQEGLELAYNSILTGVPGLKRMLRDSHGNYVGGGELIRAAKPGQNIKLSLDLRLQFLTYQALKEAYIKDQARSATAVILDVHTGEVLAMVNQPAYNPNNREGLHLRDFRNRAVTDLFEPGSTMKPFTMSSALKSGKYTPASIVDTSPGLIRVSGHTIRDFRDYGKIDLGTIIEKSSNVGASKIALSLDPDKMWHDFASFGFGEATGAYFPGEAIGHLPDPETWHTLDRASLSFGYGLATTALQLARAYTVIANGGIMRPVTFIKQDKPPRGRRIYSSDIMREVRTMMEKVVSPAGTAKEAMINNYLVAGKTGTVKKAIAGGYSDKHYMGLFAGIIPASNPQLVMVVVINDPQGGEYYGGLVAAPVFQKVMTGAMRLLNIPPDDLPVTQLRVANK